MKKLCLLVAMLLLAACGGGGGGATTATTPTNVTPSTPTGVLAINFASEHGTGKALAAFTEGPHVRIVVTNPNLRANGAAFRVIRDAGSGDVISLALPATTGYSIEALTYTTTGGLNFVSQYALTPNVTVAPIGTSTATLTLFPVAAKIVLPSTIPQGLKYVVQANYSTGIGRNITPLQSSWFLNTPRTTSFGVFSNRTSATHFSSATYALIAPYTGGTPQNLYFLGVFTLRPALLDAGETPKQWIFNSPEVSQPIYAPLNVDITAP